MSELIYRAVPGPNAHLCPKLTPEQKQQEFVKFVQRPRRYTIETRDSLEVAADILAVAHRQPGTDSELARACEANWIQTMLVLNFLHKQGLVTAYWATYSAPPDAVDELLYRLEHKGQASWPEPVPPPVIDPHAAARQAAKHKLKATLKSAGYRANGAARLRVVG